MRPFPALIFLLFPVVCAAGPVPLFDGRTFAGWEGDTGSVWRIEDGALRAGTLEQPQRDNNFFATTKEYADFDLSLKWKLEGTAGFVNGGVQFRSRRIPAHHEVSGYQADLGAGYDGALYDESRRNRILARPAGEVLEKARRPLGEWNDFRIRAEGPRIRIWLNGVTTVDYTETSPGIARSGLIAVQIHGNATSIVRYKDLVVEELPPVAVAAEKPAGELRPKDTVALVGGSNIERTRFNGFLHTQLVAARPEWDIQVHNFGWEGDTVFEQWRDGGNLPDQDPGKSWRQQRNWREQLDAAGATVVLAQFGQMESLAGKARLPAFVKAYGQLLAELAGDRRRLILVSPMPFEKTGLPHARNLTVHNADVVAYAGAIRELAAAQGLGFIDLSLLPPGNPPLTDNGYQLNENGHRVVARVIAEALGITPQPEADTAAVRQAVLEAERLRFDAWRPMNWAFLAGDRTNVPYSRDWKDPAKRLFPEEMREFGPLLQQADANIRNALSGKPVVPPGIRSSIPMEPSSAAPQTPEEELASFRIIEGFAVNLFASEADGVVKPVQMRWDERGRLWVACAVSYPQIKPGEQANDYVLVCEDTDRDGRADRFHKFVEGLFMPGGLEFGEGGLYVAQGTELLHFKDTDGDGRADGRRIVLGGFGTADSHQMINGLNQGFGGELWFTQGHHIYSRVETPFGVETLNRAGVWRYRPRTGHLDPFFQWSSAGANCWGVITTDYGQPFHKSGANIGGYFSTPGLVRSGLAVDARAMNLFQAPIKQVGMEFVGSRHFPDEMQGRVIIGGYYGNTLEQHELRYENGIFSSTLLPDIISTKNHVFRPVEIRSGPDGALYVADWYNPIIGHYQASYRHPDRDRTHGRIWRVTAKNRPAVQPAVLAGASLNGLFEQLDSPERWAKGQAKRLLSERGSGEVTAALDLWVSHLKPGGPQDEYRRLQALSVYEAHEAPRPVLLQSLLRSADPRIRAYATRALSTWARDGDLPGALALLETQIADDDALVRLEAIVAASYFPDPRAAVAAARAMDRPFNAYHHHALTKTLHATLPLWGPLVSAGKLSFDDDRHLRFALQNAWVENNPDDLKNLSGAAVSYQPRSGTDEVAVLMRREAGRHREDPAREAFWLEALAGTARPDDLGFILERGGRLPAVLAALATSKSLRGSLPQDTAAQLEPLFHHTDAAVRGQAVRLAGIWKLASFTDLILATALDENAPSGLRESALSALGDLGGPTATAALVRVIGQTNPPSLISAALEALVTASPDTAAHQGLVRLNAVRTTDEAGPPLKALLARAEGRTAFARALVAPDALTPASARLVLQAVNQTGVADRRLPPLLTKLAGLNPALPAFTSEAVARIVKAAQTSGDAVEGKKLYEQTGCTACHLPGAPASRIGPDLSALSRGLPIDMIVTEVVWPALNVKEGYEAATVTFKDGRVVTGFKHTETTDAITLRDPATGGIQTVVRNATQNIQSGGTLMPDGITATLTETQLGHLVKYLSGLGQ